MTFKVFKTMRCPLGLTTLALCLTTASLVNAEEPKKDNVPPKGFRSLFNGKDLEGWTERGQPPQNWSVQDGVLVFSGKGADLHSVEKFTNYVLHVDWKVEPKGNSGVYLRGGNPQVEINDADNPKGKIWNGTTGGLYPDLPPLTRAAKPAGQWNHFEIKVEHGVITVLTNGVKTVDDFKKKWGKQTSGSIGFQNHGTPLWVKNIYIKPLGD